MGFCLYLLIVNEQHIQTTYNNQWKRSNEVTGTPLSLLNNHSDYFTYFHALKSSVSSITSDWGPPWGEGLRDQCREGEKKGYWLRRAVTLTRKGVYFLEELQGYWTPVMTEYT